MANIKAPKSFTGERAGLTFVKGVAKSNDPDVIDWFKRKGYEVTGKGSGVDSEAAVEAAQTGGTAAAGQAGGQAETGSKAAVGQAGAAGQGLADAKRAEGKAGVDTAVEQVQEAKQAAGQAQSGGATAEQAETAGEAVGGAQSRAPAEPVQAVAEPRVQAKAQAAAEPAVQAAHHSGGHDGQPNGKWSLEKLMAYASEHKVELPEGQLTKQAVLNAIEALAAGGDIEDES